MKLISAAVLALATAAPAAAVTLDFEGSPGYANAIGAFYNGGTDSLGQSGPNYGISFTDSALALSNDELGPYFSNAPSPLTVMFGFGDAAAVMNVASGFANSLSFFYSSSAAAAGGVSIWSGLNATGSLLASFNLVNNAELGCSGPFCNFDQATVGFAGIGQSVRFAGLNLLGEGTSAVYDNIDVTPIPEPSTYLLLSAGLMLGAVAKRRAKKG